MNVSRQRILSYCLGILLPCALTACDMQDYVTWKCLPAEDGAQAEKLMMVLDRSTMKLSPPQLLEAAGGASPQSQMSYCGSLGNHSYFDKRCPPEITASAAHFTPSTGVLLLGKTRYQCAAL